MLKTPWGLRRSFTEECWNSFDVSDVGLHRNGEYTLRFQTWVYRRMMKILCLICSFTKECWKSFEVTNVVVQKNAENPLGSQECEIYMSWKRLSNKRPTNHNSRESQFFLLHYENRKSGTCWDKWKNVWKERKQKRAFCYVDYENCEFCVKLWQCMQKCNFLQL